MSEPHNLGSSTSQAGSSNFVGSSAAGSSSAPLDEHAMLSNIVQGLREEKAALLTAFSEARARDYQVERF
ncbi:hypothetical protein INT47_004425 [Mucor saturninus]|uniref:Uncharacterized protein n=1 Tax=Mucor saturninus TaxID=64648 RepID=A0A8H7UQX8_9FUNG|nr:hypothetical protein INT47_004425 [Mucor saturninus]